jgi:hypothetical protein
LLSIPSNATKPFKPVLNQFFDISVVSKISEPKKAAKAMRTMQGSPSFKRMLLQVAIFALRQKLGRFCVAFLEEFPAYLPETLASALRAVESPERVGAFEILGPPSRLFMNFAGLTARGAPVEFNQEREVPHQNLIAAAWLLPVIMEEEGPTIGFPASLFVLSKVHDSVDYIESLMRFLDPLLAKPVETPDGKLNCVGMVLEKEMYNQLRKRMFAAIEDACLDLMRRCLPHLVLALCDCFHISLKPLLVKFQAIGAQFQLLRLMDQLAPLVTNNTLERSDCRRLYRETLAGGWDSWTAALMLLSGDSQESFKFLAIHPDLKRQFRDSQWQHLIDT